MENTLAKIKEKAEDIDRLFTVFREMQTSERMDSKEFSTAKAELLRRQQTLEQELNRYVAGEFGIKPSDRHALEVWSDSHKPFHWFVEYYGIMRDGGFDVTIGLTRHRTEGANRVRNTRLQMRNLGKSLCAVH